MINTLHFPATVDSTLLKRIKLEAHSVGYYDLPNQNTDYIDNYLQKLDARQGLKNITDVVVVGIGGSSLGTRAIYHFLKPVKKLKRKLHFLDSTDPIAIKQVCQNLSIEKTHFLIVSKSGNTIETIAVYKYLTQLTHGCELACPPFSFITDKHSQLEKHARANNALVVNIQDNIGGRFSVLSSVGLIPLALVDIDISNLLAGASSIKTDFFSTTKIQKSLLKKAVFYVQNSNHYNINAVFSYTESLKYFNQWYVQLWGESLGKQKNNSNINVGLTPIGLTGPKDQHSFLQLLTQGLRDKSVTFIKLAHFETNSVIPDITLSHLENLDVMNHIPFPILINLQADSVIESLKQYKNIPIDEIIIKQQNEFGIGQLIYYYELLTSLVGDLLNINTYNQPGVEVGKKILIDKLKTFKKDHD